MSPAAGRPLEVELKFRVSDLAAAEHYLAADTIGSFSGGAAARSTQLEDRYVDTVSGALTRAGFAVRLRQSGSETILSVKSLARTQGPGGAVRREELEGPADRTASPLAWPASDARSLVLELAGDAPLVELVTIRQLRRKRIIRDGETRVEISLDEVDVVARSRVIDRFVELEAELVKGDEARLSDLAAIFAADPGLAAEQGSKFEAALRTVRGQDASSGVGPDQGDPEPLVEDAEDPSPPLDSHLVVGKSPGVTADDHVAEAARKVFRFQLARMLAREAGVRLGQNLDDVHAMRVATRRQRAAWRVFGGSFRTNRTSRYRKGLREIAGRLGAVRDLDVLIEAAERYAASLAVAEQRAMEPLLLDWRTHRDDARLLLVRELDSDGYRQWVDDYREFVRTEGAGVVLVGAVQPHRIRDTSASRIWAAYEQVRGYESVLRWADVETLHELRIAGKWLRYTLEFVREALGDDAAPLIARVTALQDHLGLMNDADVTASMARTFLVERAGDLSAFETATIGRYLVSRERDLVTLRRGVGQAWRGVAGVGFRRALGRVVSRL